MTLFTPVCERVALLPRYLSYYQGLGVTQFVLALWNGEDNPCYAEAVAKATGYNVAFETSVRCEYSAYNGPAETNGLNVLREKYVPDGGWYAIADLDEFCWFGGYNMTDLPKLAEERGYLAIHGTFRDRLGPNGELMELPVNDSLDDTFPIMAWVTRTAGACCDKIALAHKSVPIHSGHHEADGINADTQLWRNLVEVHHFKWVKGLPALLMARHRHYTSQGLWWAGESRNFVDMMKDERFDLTDERFHAMPTRRLGI